MVRSPASLESWSKKSGLENMQFLVWENNICDPSIMIGCVLSYFCFTIMLS